MSRNLILESLQFKREVQESYRDEFVGDILHEPIEWDSLCSEKSSDIEIDESGLEPIDEAKAVTFGKKAYPKQGWAVVMAGGAGSGKGHTIEKQVLIDAKILDVDAMKTTFAKISAGKPIDVKQPVSKTTGTVTPPANTRIGQMTGNRDYNFKNSDDVKDLHALIGTELELDKKREATLLNSVKQGSGFLTNLIYDITGKSRVKLINIATTMKKMGYSTSLIWVVTNRQVAMLRNLLRDRVVGQDIFHDIHNQVNDTILDFLKSDSAKDYDEAWIVFSSSKEVTDFTQAEQDELRKDSVFKLKKTGNSFEVSDELVQKVMDFLGPKEVTPSNPTTYKDFGAVSDILASQSKDEKGRTVGYKDLNFMK